MKPFNENINFKSLIEIAGGDEKFIRDMLILFCKNSLTTMKDLNLAFQQGDYIQVGSFAHKLKSSVQIVADKNLHALVKKIELIAKSTSEKKDFEGMIDQLNDSITELIKAIEIRLENPDPFT